MNDTQTTTDAPAPIEQPKLKGVAKKIAESKRKLAEVQEMYRQEIELLLRMASIIDRIPDDIAEKCNVYAGTQIDIDHLSREQAVAVMGLLHAGKWDKTINSGLPDMIDYETKIDGVTVRLWAAGPPDSCRVIETEEIIPATTITRRRLVCSDKEAL